MDAWTGIDINTKEWTATSPLAAYKERTTYDANGNILTYLRNGTTDNGNLLEMDDLTYTYISQTNKLIRVDDNSTYALNYTEDIDSQIEDPFLNYINYQYDRSGNITSDANERLRYIWNAYGKLDSVYNYETTLALKFYYDAMGNRIGKKMTKGAKDRRTWYVRDAAGNVMATYDDLRDTDSEDHHLTLKEQTLYGSSRFGVYQVNVQLFPDDQSDNTFHPGLKQYELTNHLGNVLATVSDLKGAVDITIPADGIVDFERAVVKTEQSYYPFGMLQPEMSYAIGGSKYRYGFNGQEKVDEISGSGNHNTALFWEYDTRLGRRWNVDPVVKPWESSYACLNNSPIRILDPNGDDGYVDEDGNSLGDDGDKKSHETRVINKDVWKTTIGENKDGKLNDITDATRKSLQTNIGTDKGGKTTGTSKLLDQYEKGINISDETWKTLTDNGGTKLLPFVENNTSQTVFYKPEGKVDGKDVSPYVSNNGAYPIGPGKDLYSRVDGVNSTTIDPQKVYKVPTGYRVVITNSGPDIINFLENATFGVYGERDAPDESWNALRDAFNHLPSRAPKK